MLTKHCKTSKEGKIALSNTLVETAIKVHNSPIKVTCDDYPGEYSIYEVKDLIKPEYITGPFVNKFGEGTYSLCVYPWKGVAISTPKEVEEIVESVVAPVVTKKGKNYVITTSVVVTTVEEKEVSLSEFVGLIIHQTRISRGLSQAQLSNLTGGKVSASSISQIETNSANPILSSLEHISEALGLHISDLFPLKN